MSSSSSSSKAAASRNSAERKLRIAIIHPDLGIGGAEKLVVDTALGLRARGHEVELLTSHHDPKHCFEPTRDGTLKVHLMKTYIPRSLFNTLHLPFAIAAQFSLLFQLLVALLCFRHPGQLPPWLYPWLSSVAPLEAYDVVFVDQLSAVVPWIRHLTATRVVFFCHYPDKEVGNSIARQRAIARGQSGPGIMRALYRIPLDLFEEATTSSSDKILVNSHFTQRQFQASFPRLRRLPRVVYPGVDVSAYEPERVRRSVEALGELGVAFSVQNGIRNLCMNTNQSIITLVSINRFEAKKNIALALESFARVKALEALSPTPRKLRLIIAGGYDRRVRDNIDTLRELEAQATALQLAHTTLFWQRQPFEPPESVPPPNQMAAKSVVFLPSLPGVLLPALLLSSSTKILLYTPADEHFGIVPVEAMACGVPVLASNSGGPLESVVDAGAATEDGGFANAEATGLLRQPKADVWTTAIKALLDANEATRSGMSRNARERVKERFSLEVMTDGMESAIKETHAMGPIRVTEGLILWASTLFIFIVTLTTYIMYIRSSSSSPSLPPLPTTSGAAADLAAAATASAASLGSSAGAALKLGATRVAGGVVQAAKETASLILQDAVMDEGI